MGSQQPWTESQRVDMLRRIEEIRARPHPGRLARKLRKRQGISVEEMAELVGVGQDAVVLAEKSGVITCIAHEASMAYALGDLDEDPSFELIDRYVALLKPTADEEQVLRHDPYQDLAWLMDTFKALLPPELWEELKNRPPPDPWALDGEQKRKPKIRSRRPSLSPLNVVGSRRGGKAVADKMTASDGKTSVVDLCPQPLQSQSLHGVIKIKIRVVTVIDGKDAEAVDLHLVLWHVAAEVGDPGFHFFPTGGGGHHCAEDHGLGPHDLAGLEGC